MADPQREPDGGLWQHLKWSLLMLLIVVGIAMVAIPVLNWFGIEPEESASASEEP